VTSTEDPSVIAVHEGHFPQGDGVGPSLQFSALASILAVVVLPTPLGLRIYRRGRSSTVKGRF